ncbi:MAG: hypothetical protein RIS41_857 [Actinomycetota bacterium]|jgi:hypothetical protein
MAPRSSPEQSEILRRLGLRPGEEVRFRRADRGRWQEGRISWVERDGSITVHDAHGAARSLRPERLEVRRPGRRGRPVWRPITEVAVTWEQLTLF